MKKIIFTAVALLTLSVGSILVFAHRGGDFGRGFGGRGGFLFGRMAKELNLTEAQKAQIKQLMEAEKSKVKPIIEDIKENRQKMEELTADGNFDEVKVKRLADEQAILSSQLIVERERTISQIFQNLTAEQREKAKQLKQQMEDKKRERRNYRSDKSTDNPAE